MNETRHRLVTVFGGSGFLGRELVKRLGRRGTALRVAVRHPDSVSAAEWGKDVGDVSAVYADVREETSLATAVEGAHAVVNAVGLYVERGEETFEAVHAQRAASRRLPWTPSCQPSLGRSAKNSCRSLRVLTLSAAGAAHRS